MKSITLFAVTAAFAAVLTSNLNAQALHVQRGLANETRVVPGTGAGSVSQPHVFLHRGDLVGHPTKPGVTPDALNRNLGAVSPRLLATFPQLGKAAASTADMAACKTMKKGDCSLPCCKTAAACAMPCCKS